MHRLKNIDWATLNHAYGSAEDVPELLLMLTSTAKAEREYAITELCGNIYHQGTIYQATGYAIPFLLETLFDSKTIDKELLIGLLASIAYGKYERMPEVHVIDELKKANSKFYNFRVEAYKGEQYEQMLLKFVMQIRERLEADR